MRVKVLAMVKVKKVKGRKMKLATWCSGYAPRLLLLWEKRRKGSNPLVTKAVLPPAPLFPAGNKSGPLFGTHLSGLTETTPLFRPYRAGATYRLIF